MAQFSAQDKRFMRRALMLARRGQGKTWPNPAVGCVIVRDGKIVGEGWHKHWGGPHAEAEALRQTGQRARGATAYVTLEPCVSFPGKKTPPCAEALAQEGLARVVAAALDPHAQVKRKGMRTLARAGVQAQSGLLSTEAADVNRDYFARFGRNAETKARPHVVLKMALSLDGRPFAEGGRSKWITSDSSRAETHRLRASCDAVLVGLGTVLADNPALTTHGLGRGPIRVILDSRLRIPQNAHVLDGRAPTWILIGRRHSGLRTQNSGLDRAEVIPVALSGGRIDLKAALEVLARRGVRRLLVEGGPTVWASFLREGFVDEARIFLAPKLLSGSRDPNRSPVVKGPRLKRLGSDFLFYGTVGR